MRVNTTEDYWNELLIEYIQNDIKDKPKFLKLEKWNVLWGFYVPYKKFRVLPVGKIMRLPMLKPNNFKGFELLYLKRKGEDGNENN